MTAEELTALQVVSTAVEDARRYDSLSASVPIAALDALLASAARAAELKAEVAKLQAFKAYCHERMDGAGIATHPEGPHSEAGCRIGDRLDLLIGQRDSARAAMAATREIDAEALRGIVSGQDETEGAAQTNIADWLQQRANDVKEVGNG